MPISRRRMLMLTLGSGFLAAGVTSHSESNNRRELSVPEPVTRRGWALGSDVTMSVLCDSPRQAADALDAAFAELETVEQVMSLYRPDSQVCRLNRDKSLASPHPYLLEVLAAASAMSRQSDGSFDITVQPLWVLNSSCQKSGRLPTDAEIEAARRAIDWSGVIAGQDGVRLRSPVEAITLNGIAQGFAADRALAALRAAGIRQALVNTGEIGSAGSRSIGQPWRAGIQHPRDPDAFAAVVGLDGRSLATSGDYETTFSSDRSRNHLFDPRTGRSPEDLASVSIVAPNGLQADALSTAAMVLGAERTLSLIRRLPDVDAFLVRKSGQILQTPGFPEVDV